MNKLIKQDLYRLIGKDSNRFIKQIRYSFDVNTNKYNLSKDDVELFIGHGHAKGRNTVMYYALKENIILVMVN